MMILSQRVNEIIGCIMGFLYVPLCLVAVGIVYIFGVYLLMLLGALLALLGILAVLFTIGSVIWSWLKP